MGLRNKILVTGLLTSSTLFAGTVIFSTPDIPNPDAHNDCKCEDVAEEERIFQRSQTASGEDAYFVQIRPNCHLVVTEGDNSKLVSYDGTCCEDLTPFTGASQLREAVDCLYKKVFKTDLDPTDRFEISMMINENGEFVCMARSKACRHKRGCVYHPGYFHPINDADAVSQQITDIAGLIEQTEQIQKNKF